VPSRPHHFLLLVFVGGPILPMTTRLARACEIPMKSAGIRVARNRAAVAMT
jgi:hypothetical protein